MPPMFSKPLAQLVEVETENAENAETETGPCLPLDVSDIINNAVANFKLNSDSNHTKHKRKFKFPCGICEKSVNKNQKSMHCDSCNFWIHKSCEGLTEDEFQRLVEEDDDIPFSMLTCKIKQNAEIFPFGLLSKFELLDLYGIDLPSLVETFPCFETRSRLTMLPNISDFDIDENLISTISSKYYDLNEIN